MMHRRYDAYRDAVVRPFFRDHFARLDRQIVLVDVLAALDAGPEAMRDLQDAMVAVLDCFRIGRGGWLSALFSPRADRILFAATKADQLHHSAHDRLEAILKRITQSAIARAGDAGAEVDVIALAAVRATREALVRGEGGGLPSIVGVATPGEWSSGAATSTARPRWRSFRATCRADGRPCRAATSGRSASGRRRWRKPTMAFRRCPTSASTARCNSSSGTGCDDRNLAQARRRSASTIRGWSPPRRTTRSAAAETLAEAPAENLPAVDRAPQAPDALGRAVLVGAVGAGRCWRSGSR